LAFASLKKSTALNLRLRKAGKALIGHWPATARGILHPISATDAIIPSSLLKDGHENTKRARAYFTIFEGSHPSGTDLVQIG
jgi:hypothetical protein